MATSMHRVRDFWQTRSDAVRRERDARAARHALELDLASYRSPREIDDLLALVDQQPSADAELIRDILEQNARPDPELKLIA